MKNKKIIALFCAMVMIFTAMSSIFVVNADGDGTFTMSVSEPENGEYTVTVSHKGFKEQKITAVTIGIQMGNNLKFVGTTDDIALDAALASSGVANYDPEAEEVLVAFSSSGDLLSTDAGEVFSFKVQLKDGVKETVNMKFNQCDYTDSTDGVMAKKKYSLTSTTNPTKVDTSAASIVYVAPWVAGEPAITLSSEKNAGDSDTYKITVNYDMSKLDTHKMTSMTIGILMVDGLEFVGEEGAEGIALDAALASSGVANYDPEAKEVLVAFSSSGALVPADKDNGVLFTFNVRLTSESATLSVGTANLTDSSAGVMAKKKFSIGGENNVHVEGVTISSKEEPTPIPTTTATTTPSDETPAPTGDTTPTPTLAPTATPKPIIIPGDAVVKTDDMTIGGHKLNAYTINPALISLSAEKKAELTAAGVTEVLVVLQGYKVNSKDNSKTPLANVTISMQLDELGAETARPYTASISGADETYVNIYNAKDTSETLGERQQAKK